MNYHMYPMCDNQKYPFDINIGHSKSECLRYAYNCTDLFKSQFNKIETAFSTQIESVGFLRYRLLFWKQMLDDEIEASLINTFRSDGIR